MRKTRLDLASDFEEQRNDSGTLGRNLGRRREKAVAPKDYYVLGSPFLRVHTRFF